MAVPVNASVLAASVVVTVSIVARSCGNLSNGLVIMKLLQGAEWMARTLYLKSYDRFDEVLGYALPEGEFAIIPRSGLPAGVTDLTFGAFTREGERVAGIFASPEGPVFFLDTRRVVCRFSQTSATTAAASDGSMRRFTLIQEDAGSERVEFSLLYEERAGIGANPYDTEPEDIDLFAMIAAGLRREQFFRNYTRDWPQPGI
jgi:hypothetical protein